MPLYSDMYHNYYGNTPVSFSSSPYSLPSYSSSTAYSSTPYSSPYTTPSTRITSSVPRYLPKLTTISETPLSKHRLAALTRISSPKSPIIRRQSPKYVPPRPRRIDTSDIDVSAKRYANRRISDVKPRDITEPIRENPRDDSIEDVPMKGRTTIRRDRGLVRLRTVRLPSPNREIEVEPPVKIPPVEKLELKTLPIEEKATDIDPGYGSSERSSGSWRKNFEGELDLYGKKVTSPTAKTPGENFLEKYHIKSTDNMANVHYLTIDDVPYEKRDSVRRRSEGKLPSFKEICSDISSDKLTDDLNAGDLRRRASLIIEEEMNKILQSESEVLLNTLEKQLVAVEDDCDKRKSRKVKKLRQKITAKTSIENPEPPTSPIKAVIANVEIEETAFDLRHKQADVIVELSADGENKTFKVPLRKKKKVTDIETKITCDEPIVSPPTTIDAAPKTKTGDAEATTSAEMKTNEKDDRKTHEPVVNIKASDLDSKLLLDKKDEVDEMPGEVKKVKKAVKSKTSVKAEVQVAPSMNPLRKDLSTDFWGLINSRETTVFTKRKQLVIEEQAKQLVENSWKENEEVAVTTEKTIERKSVLQKKKISLDKTETSVTETPKKNAALYLNSKVPPVKILEAKAESHEAAIVDNVKHAQNKASPTDLASKKQGKEVATAKPADESKVAPAKVVEPKVEQKREENVTKINKSEKPLQADKVSDAKPEEKIEIKKINDNILPKQTEKSDEKPLKLQPVPKPKLTLVKKDVEKTETVESPKSPPWKLAKKTEDKLPDTPKSPPCKLAKLDSPKVEPLKIESVKVEPLKAKIKEPSKVVKVPKVTPKKVEVSLAKKPENAKIEEKPKEEPKVASPVKKLLPKLEESSVEVKAKETLETAVKMNKPKEIQPKTVTEPSIMKVMSKKSVEKVSDAKQLLSGKTQAVVKALDQKLSSDDKSKSSLIVSASNEAKKSEPSTNSSVIDQSLITSSITTSDSLKAVNDQAGKKKQLFASCEGQKLETEEAKVLNETKITPEPIVNSDESKLVNSSSKTSLGKLSKFPTLNNLNSYATIEQNTDQSNNNDAIKSETIEKTAKELQSESKSISVAIESIKASAPLAPPVKKEESESESEEESSYEDDSEESSDEMEKKDFDPQKKIKVDFSQLRKCYGNDEKSTITLVARPRPLWKIKRNRHAVFSESETESSSADEANETRSTAGDSATGSSQSSTQSEKLKKKIGRKAEDSLPDNITALMPALSVQDDKNGDESIDGDGKKKNRLSTSSQDSGFCGIGATAAKSPRKALDCDVNCHKKCEKLAANLCGVNQKLIVEALASVRQANQERLEADASRSRESLTPPSLNPAYKIEINHDNDDDSETSYTYAQFQKTGKLTAPATVIPRFRKYNVEDFHFLTVLGKGSFGKVFLAELRNTEYCYAVKCLKKDVVLEDDDVECTLIERKVLALGTKHPYLCHLFCTFQTDSHLFFVMEYLNGGDLMFHIQQSGRFTEKRAKFYGAEIVSGLKFLHRKGIVYRDLKLDNVLLDHDGHVRIADFGMCKLEVYLDKTADSFCGTPDYMAPEIIKGLHYNQSVDWWSFGVLLYEMLIGQSPFSGCDEDELFWSICNEIPWYPHYLSKEALKCLQALLEKDVSIRLGTLGAGEGDVKYHPFFKEINWERLERRDLEPPFKPQVRHPLDTQYFDSQFTRERARLTPIDKNILISMNQKQFEGFSYTNPNATLT